MIIQNNSRQGTEMSSASDFRLRTSMPNGQAGNLFEVEYWVTGKEADTHLFQICFSFPEAISNNNSLDLCS